MLAEIFFAQKGFGARPTDMEIIQMYSEFCEDTYAASWIDMDDGMQKGFISWLTDLANRDWVTEPEEPAVEKWKVDALPALRDTWERFEDKVENAS